MSCPINSNITTNYTIKVRIPCYQVKTQREKLTWLIKPWILLALFCWKSWLLNYNFNIGIKYIHKFILFIKLIVVLRLHACILDNSQKTNCQIYGKATVIFIIANSVFKNVLFICAWVISFMLKFLLCIKIYVANGFLFLLNIE